MLHKQYVKILLDIQKAYMTSGNKVDVLRQTFGNDYQKKTSELLSSIVCSTKEFGIYTNDIKFTFNKTKQSMGSYNASKQSIKISDSYIEESATDKLYDFYSLLLTAYHEAVHHVQNINKTALPFPSKSKEDDEVSDELKTPITGYLYLLQKTEQAAYRASLFFALRDAQETGDKELETIAREKIDVHSQKIQALCRGLESQGWADTIKPEKTGLFTTGVMKEPVFFSDSLHSLMDSVRNNITRAQTLTEKSQLTSGWRTRISRDGLAYWASYENGAAHASVADVQYGVACDIILNGDEACMFPNRTVVMEDVNREATYRMREDSQAYGQAIKNTCLGAIRFAMDMAEAAGYDSLNITAPAFWPGADKALYDEALGAAIQQDGYIDTDALSLPEVREGHNREPVSADDPFFTQGIVTSGYRELMARWAELAPVQGNCISSLQPETIEGRLHSVCDKDNEIPNRNVESRNENAEELLL